MPMFKAHAGYGDGIVETFPQHFTWRQLGYILGDMDAAPAKIKVFHSLPLFPSAENNSQWRIFTRLPLMPVKPVEIELHLPLVGRFEISELQFNYHKATQATMKEK